MIVNTRIGLSLISILAAAAMMAGATFALFTDAASSQDNTFSTGNADLQIAPEGDFSPGVYVNDLPAPAFSGSDIVPGFNQDFIFWLKNDSSSEIGLDISVDLDDIGGSEALQDALLVQFVCADPDGENEESTDQQSVNAWETGLEQSLGTITDNDDGSDGIGTDEKECTMNVELPSDAESDIGGASVNFDGIFDATQSI